MTRGADERIADVRRLLEASARLYADRARLVPEWPIYRLIADHPAPRTFAGRIDAIA